MAKLDAKDREILYQLDLDARQPNARIARKVRASKEVVGYRIARMENEGAIDGYYVLVDITRLGCLNGRMFFKFKGMTPRGEQEFHEYFNRSSRAWWVNSISGSFTDSGVAFWLKDINDFHALKEEILGRYRGRIEFFRDSIYSRMHIWRRSYLSAKGTDGRKPCAIAGSSLPVKFDAQDIRLLSALTRNARLPLVELAQKAGMGAAAARSRLQRLVKEKVILGFRPKLNLSKLGYYWYKIEFQLEDYAAKKRMLAYFASHPNVIYAYESIGGGTDLEMELEIESYEQFRSVVDGIRSKFKEAIRSYSYYMWSAEHKIAFFPPEEFFGKKG